MTGVQTCALPIWYINTSPIQITGDVLAEIGNLQSGANGIGIGDVDCVVAASEIQHKLPDGIGRMATIVELLGDGQVSRLPLVLLKSKEQIVKRLLGYLKGFNGIDQRDEYGVRCPATVAISQQQRPPMKEFAGLRRRFAFIGQVVGPAAVGIEMIKMRTQFSRQQATGHGEVFVV